nr:hypothetical protein [Tanacetum cinerariifolium]
VTLFVPDCRNASPSELSSGGCDGGVKRRLLGHGDEICECVWILGNLDIRDLIDYAVN